MRETDDEPRAVHHAADPVAGQGGEAPARAHLVRPRLKRRRNRWVWGLAALAAILVGLAGAYRYATRPTQIRVAVSDEYAGDVAVLNAYARYFAANKLNLRLSVQTFETRESAAQAFLDGRADLVVARAETNLRGRAGVIAVMSKSVGLVVSFDPKIDDIAKIRGKRVAVPRRNGVGDSFFAALLRAYDLKETDVQRVDVAETDLQKAVLDRKVDVAIGASPLVARRAGETLRALLKQKKIKVQLLPVDRAPELVRLFPAFEEFDMPERSVGSLPAEEMKSVAMPTNLLARLTLRNDVAAALARQFLSNKQAVIAEAPSVAQISAPQTDKDAFLRAHPGVAAYIDDDEQTFFDRFGDLIYIGMAVAGVFASGFMALRRSFGPDTEADACDLIDDLIALRGEARGLAHGAGADAVGARWRDLSDRFEAMLAQSLPLIADGAVADRTVQALATALTAAERAVADLAVIAVGGARRDAREGPPIANRESGT